MFFRGNCDNHDFLYNCETNSIDAEHLKYMKYLNVMYKSSGFTKHFLQVLEIT